VILGKGGSSAIINTALESQLVCPNRNLEISKIEIVKINCFCILFGKLEF